MIGEKRIRKDLERLGYLFFKAESPVAGITYSQEVSGSEVQWLPQANVQAWCLLPLVSDLSALLPFTVYSSTPRSCTLFIYFFFFTSETVPQTLKQTLKNLFPCRLFSLDTPFPPPVSIAFPLTSCVLNLMVVLIPPHWTCSKTSFLKCNNQNWCIPAQDAPALAKERGLFPVFTGWRCFYFPEWCLTVCGRMALLKFWSTPDLSCRIVAKSPLGTSAMV